MNRPIPLDRVVVDQDNSKEGTGNERVSARNTYSDSVNDRQDLH